MSTKTVPLLDAKAYAKKWQSENGFHCKAHLMPAADLIAALEEMGVLVGDGKGNYTLKDVANSGVRAYLAIKRPDGDMPTPISEKLLIVGTYKDSKGEVRDIIKGEKVEYGETEIEARVSSLTGTGIFDFTAPCPSECDPNSPLYNP